MTEPIYCREQISRGGYYEPPEFCETEVDQPGDLCPRHDEDDRADADYENYLESLRKEP